MKFSSFKQRIQLAPVGVGAAALCLLATSLTWAGPGAGSDWRRLQGISLNFQTETLEAWKKDVRERLDLGFYIGERRKFFLDLLAENLNGKTIGHLVETYSVRASQVRKLEFDQEFTSLEHAKKHARRKMECQNHRRWVKADSLRKWTERTQLEGYPENIPLDSRLFRIHGIDFLWQQKAPEKEWGLSGDGVLVGLMESYPGNGSHEDIANYLTHNSIFLDDHGKSMVAVVASETPTVFDKDPVAPGATVHAAYGRWKTDRIRFHYAGKHPIVVPFDQTKSHADHLPNKRLPTSYELIMQPYKKVPTDFDAIRALIDSGTKIIAMPRSLVSYDLQTNREEILKYIRSGGVFIHGLGNEGVVWDLDHIPDLMPKMFHPEIRVPLVDLVFFEWLNNEGNEELKQGFIFVSNLSADGSVLSERTSYPGTFADQTVAVIGSGRDAFFGSKGRRAGEGTSYSVMVLAGVFSLLSEAFPNCSPQDFRKAILETASSDGLSVILEDEKPHSVDEFDGRNKGRFFGRGRLNAKEAYLRVSGHCASR